MIAGERKLIVSEIRNSNQNKAREYESEDVMFAAGELRLSVRLMASVRE